MGRYKVKTVPGAVMFIDVLADLGDEFDIEITSRREDDERRQRSRLSKPMFELCLRTGYIAAAQA